MDASTARICYEDFEVGSVRTYAKVDGPLTIVSCHCDKPHNRTR